MLVFDKYTVVPPSLHFHLLHPDPMATDQHHPLAATGALRTTGWLIRHQPQVFRWDSWAGLLGEGENSITMFQMRYLTSMKVLFMCFIVLLLFQVLTNSWLPISSTEVVGKTKKTY